MGGVIHGGRKRINTQAGIELSKAAAADRHAASLPRSCQKNEARAHEGEAFGASEGGEGDGEEDVNSDRGGGGGGGGRKGERGGGTTETEEGDGVGSVRANGSQGVGGRLAW